MDVLELAHQLDDKLGNPRDPVQLFSFAQRVAEDEMEYYPAKALGALVKHELHLYNVPSALGGKLERFDQLGAMLRVVARRDLTVAITHAISFLGTAIVWMAGSDIQRRTLAKAALAGERVSVALTEQGSGSDLLNMKTVADFVDSSYRLKGEKWLGNGFDRNRFIIVYARTSDKGGPRGFSLFLVDKVAIPGGFRVPTKIPTLGVRGADVSDISFDVTLSTDALIGVEGSGFETVLKALQLSRTLCGTLSLGALETGLETVLRFAIERTVYGKHVTDLPQSQKLLAETWAELLIADSLTGLALRGLQMMPAQASVHSAVVKYFVPTLAEQAMNKLSVVYGARYYLRDDHEYGIFQKMYRDNLLIGLFDGSTQVNLFSLSQQLRALITHTQQAEPPVWTRRDMKMTDFDWHGLSLSAGGQSALFGGFDAGISALRTWLHKDVATDVCGWIEVQLCSLSAAKSELVAAIHQLSPALQVTGDSQAFEMARRYCVVTTAASVMADWQYNRFALSDTMAQPAVLAVMLQRLAAQLGNEKLLPSQCYRDTFAALLARRKKDGQCGLYQLPITTSQVSVEYLHTQE